VARTVRFECAPVTSGTHLYVLSLSLCVGLSCLSPKSAVAACAEDLTRIEFALQNVSSDLRERLEPILVDAKQKARLGDRSGCNSATAQALRELGMPILASVGLQLLGRAQGDLWTFRLRRGCLRFSEGPVFSKALYYGRWPRMVL
jgi:hypothetical protein